MQSRLPSYVLLALFIGLFLAVGPLSRLITDWMWFAAIGFEPAFLTRIGTQAAAGIVTGLFAFGLVYTSLRYALAHTRKGPVRAADFQDNQLGLLLARTPPNQIAGTAGGVVGLIMGLTATTWWQHLLLLMHHGSFQFEDPIMGLDAGFYVFLLPVLLEVRSALLGLLIFTGILTLGIYITGGGIQVQLVERDGQLMPQGLSVKMEARRHIASLTAAILVVLSLGFFLARYSLLYDAGDLIAGPGYADVHGALPLLTLQAVATAIAAFVAFIGISRLSMSWVVGAGALVVVFSGVSAIYPGVVQRFSVLPNELTREAPFIVDHIEATRHAFDLHRVEELPLSGENELSIKDIDDNSATVQNVRLWDHTPALATFSQMQEIRTYYAFHAVDNDRYLINGELRQTMLSPRELDSKNLPERAKTWVNELMTYTHGYGVALGPVNEVTAEGLPVLFVKDLPPKIVYPDDLGIDRPEIYYGEVVRREVYVNTANSEFDYPSGDENKYTNYAGKGGVRLGPLGRYLFSLRFGSSELLFSGDIDQDSKVLLHRNIVDRVQRIAPFLRLDPDPYMVIADGRLVWVIDAYTTTDRFPYSQRVGDGILGARYNYMRNSVKVAVDAYDGTVQFFIADEADPIVNAWKEAFPGMFQSMDALPAALRTHLRYPQHYFSVQSELFATYHMREHQIFYNREDEWEVPQLGDVRMKPYYTIMKLPGGDSEEFILMLPFNPVGKPNLAAWMVARSDGEHYGGLRVYKFPKEKMVYGPNMIAARINQDDEISQNISLWNQEGSKVEMGTMLVIPVEESLIYVQPLYLQAESGRIPELKRVIVAYENNIAMKPTLREGLAEIFGVSEPPPRPTEVGPRPAAPTDDGSWEAIAAEATALWDEANAAAAAGDWTTYGATLSRLGEAMEQLRDLSGATPEVEAAP